MESPEIGEELNNSKYYKFNKKKENPFDNLKAEDPLKSLNMQLGLPEGSELKLTNENVDKNAPIKEE